MYKVITWLVLISIFSIPTSNLALALTRQYDAKCLDYRGKFSKCTVAVGNDELTIEYRNRKTNPDLHISGKSIKALSAGEIAKRRVGLSVAAAILISPLALLGLLSKKKLEHIGVEYLDENRKTQATMIEISKKNSLAFKGDLKALSGKQIQDEGPITR